MTPRRMAATVVLTVFAAVESVLSTSPAQAGWFGCCDGYCKLCPYGAKYHCTAPCPTLLNECHGYFPTQWQPWPCPQAHAPAVVAPPWSTARPPATPEKTQPPAEIMPPVR